MSDYIIASEFQDNYRYAHDFWAPFLKDAEVYTLAASGYTWSWDERKQLIKEGREPLEFNIMRRPLQFFSGYLRDNINSIIYAPVEGSDQKTADQFTELGYYVWDKGHIYKTFLDFADEGMKSGMALCGLQMDYSKDFENGDICAYGRTYNSFILDPTFSEINLIDCGFAIQRDLITKDYAKQLLKEVPPEEIDAVAHTYRDEKFMQYHPQFTTFARNRNLVAYDQYHRRKTRDRLFLLDVETGFYRDITELPAEDKKRLRMGVKRLKETRQNAEIDGLDLKDIPNVEIKTVNRGFVELHIMLNGQHMWTGEDPTGIVDTYPFVPLICYMEPAIWLPSQRVQGMASCQYTAQRAFNKRHMKIVDMMDSTISTGFKYLIGTVNDPSDMQQSGQSRLIGVNKEDNPAGLDAVQQLQGGGANPALMEYQAILDKLTLTLGNVTEASLGMDEKRNTLVSGRLAQVQIAQNLMSNRRVFDNIEYAQELLGGLVLKAMQTHMPPGKVERILGEKPTEQFYDGQFEQYDAVIKEGVRSKSQKDAYYYELVNLKRDGIIDVPESAIVEALQMAGLSKLEEAIKRQEDQKAQQQQKLDAYQKLEMELMGATKEEKLGLAQERRTRADGNEALVEERASEAEENRAQAALARAKTITEVAAMQDERILKVLEFVNQLERQEAADRDQILSTIHAQADQTNSETQGSAQNQTLQAAQQEANGGLPNG